MNGYLLDTNVISELTTKKPDVGVVRFLKNMEAGYVSVVSVHELYFGLERLPSGSKRRQNLTSAVEDLLEIYQENILSVSQSEARVAASMRASMEAAGRTLHLADALLAASSFRHGLTLVTRNEKDFAGLLLQLINPWVA